MLLRLSIIVAFAVFVGVSEGSLTKYQRLDALLQNYDKRLRPGGNEPLNLTFSSYMLQVDDINLVKKEVKLVFYFRQYWTDERLDVTEDTVLRSPDDLWTPDMYIVNEVKEPALESEHYVKISPGGEVLWSQRLTKKIKAGCMKKFEKQGEKNFKIEMESYGYRADNLAFQAVDSDKFLHSFDTQHLDAGCISMESFEHKVTVSETLSGAYNRLTLTLKLKKKHM